LGGLQFPSGSLGCHGDILAFWVVLFWADCPTEMSSDLQDSKLGTWAGKPVFVCHGRKVQEDTRRHCSDCGT
jgi:hypothetical protein